MSNLDTQTRAYNYFVSIEENGLAGLSSNLWVAYIQLGNELHKKNVKVRKCARRVKQNHTYLSDYFFNSLK